MGSTRFFPWYNDEHRDSGLGHDRIHHDQAKAIHQRRAEVLQTAYTGNPERFVRHAPQPPELPTAAWINNPKTPATDSEEPDQKEPPRTRLIRLDRLRKRGRARQELSPANSDYEGHEPDPHSYSEDACWDISIREHGYPEDNHSDHPPDDHETVTESHSFRSL